MRTESCFFFFRGGGHRRSCWWGIDPAMERESQSPLSHPFEIQVQGHEPREEWQRGPAPGQTGSHRTGPQSSSPGLAPSHCSPPRLDQAYGSQAADPQWTGRSPALLSSISDPLLGLKQQNPPGREALRSLGGASTASQLLLHPGLWMGAQCSLLLMITPTSPPGRSAFRALCRSTHPHGNSGRAVHTM